MSPAQGYRRAGDSKRSTMFCRLGSCTRCLHALPCGRDCQPVDVPMQLRAHCGDADPASRSGAVCVLSRNGLLHQGSESGVRVIRMDLPPGNNHSCKSSQHQHARLPAFIAYPLEALCRKNRE